MNRTRFMRELEQLLKDLPDSERREAIQYYNDYFDDAGPENESRVIQELESPEKVAKTIREGMSESGEYTEHGYEDARFRRSEELSNYRKEPDETAYTGPKSPNLRKLLSILLLCLLLFPIVVSIFAALLGTLLAVFLGIGGLILGVVLAAVALPVAGVALIGIAFYNLFFHPAVGITLGGIGCLLLSVGIVLFLLAVWAGKSFLPFCIRTIVSVIRYPLRKAGMIK